MGEMYTRGVNGIEVGTFNSGDGSSQLIGSFQITSGICKAKTVLPYERTRTTITHILSMPLTGSG